MCRGFIWVDEVESNFAVHDEGRDMQQRLLMELNRNVMTLIEKIDKMEHNISEIRRAIQKPIPLQESTIPATRIEFSGTKHWTVTIPSNERQIVAGSEFCPSNGRNLSVIYPIYTVRKSGTKEICCSKSEIRATNSCSLREAPAAASKQWIRELPARTPSAGNEAVGSGSRGLHKQRRRNSRCGRRTTNNQRRQESVERESEMLGGMNGG
ncbi:Uncharacterized protein Adt_40985 [Abeliophyllum distichum]|uniref:Uncharacterized protein n=1 Tax=Abeliophyllum distichum TaxID=126358 RepID=A0ABD1PNC4_9LAMI